MYGQTENIQLIKKEAAKQTNIQGIFVDCGFSFSPSTY